MNKFTIFFLAFFTNISFAENISLPTIDIISKMQSDAARKKAEIELERLNQEYEKVKKEGNDSNNNGSQQNLTSSPITEQKNSVKPFSIFVKRIYGAGDSLFVDGEISSTSNKPNYFSHATSGMSLSNNIKISKITQSSVEFSFISSSTPSKKDSKVEEKVLVPLGGVYENAQSSVGVPTGYSQPMPMQPSSGYSTQPPMPSAM